MGADILGENDKKLLRDRLEIIQTNFFKDNDCFENPHDDKTSREASKWRSYFTALGDHVDLKIPTFPVMYMNSAILINDEKTLKEMLFMLYEGRKDKLIEILAQIDTIENFEMHKPGQDQEASVSTTGIEMGDQSKTGKGQAVVEAHASLFPRKTGDVINVDYSPRVSVGPVRKF